MGFIPVLTLKTQPTFPSVGRYTYFKTIASTIRNSQLGLRCGNLLVFVLLCQSRTTEPLLTFDLGFISFYIKCLILS